MKKNEFTATEAKQIVSRMMTAGDVKEWIGWTFHTLKDYAVNEEKLGFSLKEAYQVSHKYKDLEPVKVISFHHGKGKNVLNVVAKIGEVLTMLEYDENGVTIEGKHLNNETIAITRTIIWLISACDGVTKERKERMEMAKKAIEKDIKKKAEHIEQESSRLELLKVKKKLEEEKDKCMELDSIRIKLLGVRKNLEQERDSQIQENVRHSLQKMFFGN